MAGPSKHKKKKSDFPYNTHVDELVAQGTNSSLKKSPMNIMVVMRGDSESAFKNTSILHKVNCLGQLFIKISKFEPCRVI